MEGVERTNAVVVRGSGQGAGQNMGAPPRRDPFAMEVDRGRNCYACGGFWAYGPQLESGVRGGGGLRRLQTLRTI